MSTIRGEMSLYTVYFSFVVCQLAGLILFGLKVNTNSSFLHYRMDTWTQVVFDGYGHITVM